MNAFSEKSFGFVGLGAMGFPIALRMAEAVPDLAVDDRDPERVAAFIKAKRSTKSGADSINEAEIVFMCLPSPAASRTVIDTLLSSGPRARLFIDLGANPPTSVKEMSELCRAHGMAFCDAPVFGTPSMATGGELYFLFSGPHDIGTEFLGLAQLLGYRARAVEGPAGTASTLKLLQNALGSANLLAAAEVMRICETTGIDPGLFADVVGECGGIGSSSVFDRFGEDMAARTDSGEGRLRIASKDAQSVSNLAAEIGAFTPLLDVTSQQFQQAISAGMGERQFTAIIDLIKSTGSEDT